MVMDKIALTLLVIGGINWGCVGLFQFDLVAFACGGSASLISRIVYTLWACPPCGASPCCFAWGTANKFFLSSQRPGAAASGNFFAHFFSFGGQNRTTPCPVAGRGRRTAVLAGKSLDGGIHRMELWTMVLTGGVGAAAIKLLDHVIQWG